MGQMAETVPLLRNYSSIYDVYVRLDHISVRGIWREVPPVLFLRCTSISRFIFL